MIAWFTTVEVGIAAAAGILCLILGMFRRAPSDLSLGVTLLVELLLVGQLVIAIVAPLTGNSPTGSIVEFYVYLIVALIIPILTGFWALVERDRWSTVILGIASLAVAVMMVRMNIIWTLQLA